MQIFAHRGASADAPENTLLAFDLAIAQGADGIELDVYQHGAEFVVIHDRWLQRTTNAEGLVEQCPLPSLLEVDAGQGQKIPTLQQALALIDGRCQVNIEIKGLTDARDLAAQINQVLANTRFAPEQLLLSSFDHHTLKQVKAQMPFVRIGALTVSNPLTYAAFAQQLDAYSVHIDLTFVNQAFVEDAKRRGLKVYVFTADHEADLLKLLRWRVDGVFTNQPLNTRNIINNAPQDN